MFVVKGVATAHVCLWHSPPAVARLTCRLGGRRQTDCDCDCDWLSRRWATAARSGEGRPQHRVLATTLLIGHYLYPPCRFLPNHKLCAEVANVLPLIRSLVAFAKVGRLNKLRNILKMKEDAFGSSLSIISHQYSAKVACLTFFYLIINFLTSMFWPLKFPIMDLIT